MSIDIITFTTDTEKNEYEMTRSFWRGASFKKLGATIDSRYQSFYFLYPTILRVFGDGSFGNDDGFTESYRQPENNEITSVRSVGPAISDTLTRRLEIKKNKSRATRLFDGHGERFAIRFLPLSSVETFSINIKIGEFVNYFGQNFIDYNTFLNCLIPRIETLIVSGIEIPITPSRIDYSRAFLLINMFYTGSKPPITGDSGDYEELFDIEHPTNGVRCSSNIFYLADQDIDPFFDVRMGFFVHSGKSGGRTIQLGVKRGFGILRRLLPMTLRIDYKFSYTRINKTKTGILDDDENLICSTTSVSSEIPVTGTATGTITIADTTSQTNTAAFFDSKFFTSFTIPDDDEEPACALGVQTWSTYSLSSIDIDNTVSKVFYVAPASPTDADRFIRDSLAGFTIEP